MLYVSTFFTFLNMLLGKSDSFTAVLVHVVRLVILSIQKYYKKYYNCNTFSFGYPHRFDVVSFQFIVLLIQLDRIF